MRIEVYKKDHKVSVKDFLLGTDGDKFNKTKNFPIHRISDYILSQLQNSGVVFRFSDGSNEMAPGEPGYFFSESDITDKTQITKLYFSKDSFYGEELEALFVSAGSNLGDLYLGLTQQDDTANYGFFNVGNVIDAGEYFKIDVDLRGQLFAKDFLHDKNYALFFDIASSNEFSISIEAGVFMLYKNGALVDQVDMSQYLDDTNLARLVGGSVDTNGIATFSRDDSTTFTVDFSQFLSGITPTKLSQLENDTNFVPGSQLYSRSEINNKDAAIQLQVTKLNGLYLQKDTVNNKILLKNADGTTLSTIDGYQNDGIGYSIEFDTDSRTIYILDTNSDIVDSIPVSLLVEDKMDKGGYNGTGQDLKDYIDTLLKGLKWKDSVLCATTANITLSGEQIIDGQQTNASRVLVKDQTNLTENGIYVSSATAWTRAEDADAGEELVEATVGVEQGETNKNVKFTCLSTNITLGTTDIEWGFLTEVLGVTFTELESILQDYVKSEDLPDFTQFVKSISLNGGAPQTPDVNGNIDLTIEGTGTNTEFVEQTYVDMAGLYADQVNQTDGAIQFVADAIGHPDIETGYAYLEYLGTTLGNDNDYRLLSSEEALNVVSGTGYVTEAEMESAIETAINAVKEPIPKAANYIVEATHHDRDIYADSASEIVVTLPKNSTTPIPVNFETHVWWIGVGKVSFNPATDVTLNIDETELAEIARRNNAVTLKKIAEDIWIAVGALKLAE